MYDSPERNVMQKTFDEPMMNWFMLSLFLFFVAVTGIFFISPLFVVAVPLGVGAYARSLVLENRDFKRSLEPVRIDGRTQKEWFDLIKGMGREEFERLSRPALDGLEESADNYGGWDVKALIGGAFYKTLMREFYPEKHCKECGVMDCEGICPEALFIKAEKRRQELKEKRAKEFKALPPIKKKDALNKYYGRSPWDSVQPVKKVVDVLQSTLVQDPVTHENLGLVEQVRWSDGTVEWKMASEAAFKARVKTDAEAEAKRVARQISTMTKDYEKQLVDSIRESDRQMAELEDKLSKWEREARMLMAGDYGTLRKRYYLD